MDECTGFPPAIQGVSRLAEADSKGIAPGYSFNEYTEKGCEVRARNHA
jgi:hypothetical protein